MAGTWTVYWAARSIKKSKRAAHSVIAPILIHCLFFGLPLILDAVIGLPDYHIMPGFMLAMNDENVSLIYCFYVFLFPVVLWYSGRSSLRNSSVAFSKNSAETTKTHLWIPRWVHFLMTLSIFLPAVVLMFAPFPQLYLLYGWTAMDLPWIPTEAADYHTLVNTVATLCVVGFAGLLATLPRLKPALIISYIPWVLLAIWIHGKRNIIAAVIIFSLMALWQRGYIRGKRIYSAGLLAIILVVGSSVLYQASVRKLTASTTSFEDVYANMRIDYGRDATSKLAIYAELHPDQVQILEYRGQSFLFLATILVPRSMWPDKPLPYAQYMTSAMFLRPPKLWGWGITTSWFDECLSNAGLLGVILAFAVPPLICKFGDSSRSSFVKFLTMIVSSSLLILQVAAFYPLLIIWLLLCVIIKSTRRKRSL